jgi:hypothetical protein
MDLKDLHMFILKNTLIRLTESKNLLWRYNDLKKGHVAEIFIFRLLYSTDQFPVF